MNKVIHGCLEMWNFSCFQLNISFIHWVHSWDVKWNACREIPYLCLPYCIILFINYFSKKCLAGYCMCSPHFHLEKSRPKEIAQVIELNVILDIFLIRICVDKYVYLFNSLIVSRRYPENPAIWLVPGVGSIFLSPDHGHGNQLR